MNGIKSFGSCRDRSGAIGVGPLIVVAAILAGAAIAIVVAVRAAAPASDQPVVPGTATVESTRQNPLRPADNASPAEPVAHEPAVAHDPPVKPSSEQPGTAPPKATPPSSLPEATKPSTGLPPAAAAGAHPLDPAIDLAQKLLDNLRKHVKDYSCIIVKQERTGDTIGESEFMAAKIRQDPFSVYLKFLKPDDTRGREVLYASGANDGKLLVREGSGWTRGLGMLTLPPTGPIAMHGNRYPITDLGLAHLTERLLEIAKQDRRYGEVEVHFFKDAKVNGRVCTCVEVVHPVERRVFLFYKAQIFIDDELNVPIRYAAFMWPKKPGGEPPLDECYTYLNLKLNVGLTEADFDPHNPSYHFFDK